MSDKNFGKAVHILIVEDNPGDVRLAIEALRESKIRNTISVLEDGSEVMRYLRREDKYANAIHPDLILLDLNLPKKDGREVLKEIKNDPTAKTIPVVILTTSQAEADIMKAYNLHANCYITKPVDLDQFLSVVRAIENFWLTIVKLPIEPRGE